MKDIENSEWHQFIVFCTQRNLSKTDWTTNCCLGSSQAYV